MKQKKSELEEALVIDLKHRKVPAFKRHYRFHPTRKWEFDFAWPQFMVAVEVEGGTWVRGRHTRPEGYAKDCEKYNAATELGWAIFRFPREYIVDSSGAELMQRVLHKYTEEATRDTEL